MSDLPAGRASGPDTLEDTAPPQDRPAVPSHDLDQGAAPGRPGLVLAVEATDQADEASAPRPPRGLTDLERLVLDFEGQWFKDLSAKSAAIMEHLGLEQVRYFQILNALLEHPEALAYAPQTVGRVRQQRAHTRRRRA